MPTQTNTQSKYWPKWRTPRWYWQVMLAEWRDVIGYGLVPSIAWWVLAAFTNFVNSFIGIGAIIILLLLVSPFVAGFSYPWGHYSVLLYMPVSRQELTRFVWWHHLRRMMAMLALLPAIGAVFALGFSLVGIGLRLIDSSVPLSVVLRDELHQVLQVLSEPRFWNALFRIGAFIGLALSLFAGFAVSRASNRSHWPFNALPWLDERIKRLVFIAVPAVAGCLAWPCMAQSPSLIPELLYMTWCGTTVLYARSVFQAPYFLHEQTASSRPEAKKRDAALDAPAGFPPRTSYGRWLAADVLSKIRANIRATLVVLVFSCLVFICCFLFGLNFKDPEFVHINAFMLVVGILGNIRLSFPLREYRMLPMTALRYTAVWHLCLFAVTSAAAIGYSVFIAAYSMINPEKLSIFIHLVWFLPLLLALGILIAGHALTWIKLPMALLGVVTAAAIYFRAPQADSTYWILVILLPMMVFSAGFCLEVWTVTHDRRAYFRPESIDETL